MMIGKTEVAMNEPTNVAPFRLTSAVAEKRIHEIAKSTAAVALTYIGYCEPESSKQTLHKTNGVNGNAK